METLLERGISGARGNRADGTCRYRLRCLATDDLLYDRRDRSDPFPLANPRAESPSFLRSEYVEPAFRVGPATEGLFRFRDMLPVTTEIPGSAAPVTWRSTGLAAELGLSRLFITFTGYYPDRGALVPTGTFKENEAYAVFGRLGKDARDETLVVASAGNTARAFLRAADENNLPLVVVVPEKNLADIWTVSPRGDSTIVVAAGDGSDYTDAIELAATIAALPGYRSEGGARNVARRDGMACTYLSAVHEIGALPDHYFQAVGSGTGAIAAWEANLRLLALGGYGDGKTRLHLSQNAPFTLLVDSWAARRRTPAPLDADDARRRIERIDARVLANRTPPYSPLGGLYDALVDTDGRMYAVDNDAADRAGALFAEREGIDASPAARVACASLIDAVARGAVDRDDIIMLNITGGGYRGILRDFDPTPVVPDIVADRALFQRDAIASAIDAARRQTSAGRRR